MENLKEQIIQLIIEEKEKYKLYHQYCLDNKTGPDQTITACSSTKIEVLTMILNLMKNQ